MKPAAPKLPRVLDETIDWQACQRDGRVRGAYLKGLDLSDTDLEEMTFDRCVLEQCRLTGANLERCSFTDVKLIGCELSGANCANNFLNPLYEDNKASCNIYFDRRSGIYKMKDFGNDSYSGDCFFFVALYYYF